MTHAAGLRGALLGALIAWGGCSRGDQPRPLAPHATFELYVVSAVESPGARQILDPADGAPLFLTHPPIIEAADVAAVALRKSRHGIAELAVEMTPAGAAKLNAATSARVGERLAIVANGRLVALLTLHLPLSASFAVQCDVVSREGEELFDGLTRPR